MFEMYPQGNYSSQFGQGSQAPFPQFQQHPVPPPPRPFQQGPPASQPSTIQQGPPSIPPHIGHSTLPVYQHAPPPPLPPQQVPASGMLNASQSYLPPPPLPPQQIHGSISMVHSYSVVPQNSQWTHSMHQVLPPVRPPLGPPASIVPSHPGLFRPSLPPTGSSTLPLRPPHGGPIRPPEPGNVQAIQQISVPPPPVPPTSSLFAPAPFGSFLHSANKDSNVSASVPLSPPPPPSSPPPIPPSPPPPTSPHPPVGTLPATALHTASDLSHNSESVPTSNQSGFEVVASDSVDKVGVSIETRDDAPMFAECKTPEPMTSCDVGSPMKNLSTVKGIKLDLPPPPKPAEEKIVQKIEVLCRFIAKNGPSFEDMARQKEFANPEFEFLFGGEPGSKAAVAHSYFEWMKKKCISDHDFQHELGNSVVRSPDIDTSTQTKFLKDAVVSHSPSDSDMDMEDDITQPDVEQQVGASFKGLNHERVSIPKGLDGQEQLHSLQNAAEYNVGEVPGSRSSGLAGQDKGIGSERTSGELIKGTSPFRLLQDYASEDSSENDDKPSLEEANTLMASPSTIRGATSRCEDIGLNLRRISSCEVAFGMPLESKSIQSNAPEFSPGSQSTAQRSNITSAATVKTEETVGNNNGNQESINNAASLEELNNTFNGAHEAAPEIGNSQSQKGKGKFESIPTLTKVDEFGRLVREGASDSDSDELHNARRRGKRERSWSRSRSPRDRRSPPWRRRERRSRSRSWSPRKRSRSRSPVYRNRDDSGSDKMRRDKDQLPECFNFLRGRCHRGAFCRYMHHESNKSDSARRYRSKQQYVEVPPASRTSDFHEEIGKTPPRRSVNEQDTSRSSFVSLKVGKMDREKSLQIAAQSMISDQDDKLLVAELAKTERDSGVTVVIQEAREIKEKILESATGLPDNENYLKQLETVQSLDGSPSHSLADVGTAISKDDVSHGTGSVENLMVVHSQAKLSLPLPQNADHLHKNMDDSSTADSSQVQSSSTFQQNQLSFSEHRVNKVSSIHSYPVSSPTSQSFLSQSLPPKELTPPIVPPVDFRNNRLQFPPPPPPFSQGAYTLQTQHSHVVAPNSSWSLPPPPPPPLLPPHPPSVYISTINATTAMQAMPPPLFQQHELPPRNESTSQMFVTAYPAHLPTHSQVGEFQQHRSLQMQELEPPRPSTYKEDFQPKALGMSNQMSQQHTGGTGLVEEDHFSRFPVQGLSPPNSFARGNMPPQPMKSFQGEKLPSGGPFTSLSQNHPYLQQQRPHFDLHSPATDGLPSDLRDYGNIGSGISRYTSDILEKNQLYRSDFEGSRISGHYNPYASTFDHPLGSKFSSIFFKQDKDISYNNLHDVPSSLLHVPVDGHGIGSVGPKSMQAAALPKSASDQYDPIFDSIEPASNSFKTFDHGLKAEPPIHGLKDELTNDHIMLGLSASHKPLDVEENNKQKGIGVVTVTTSVKSENDEYGETADAEVGDVENISANSPIENANIAVGEVEIDQVKMSGKSKNSKDSRSMKLFKIALADFVKDVLKPSWRQGNMSKEAFKTIVKKTVDKVSGAMKSHQIPKSQSKINQYIDSSQRKLTKLVMGYVQKYVKV
ncbi:uncharacterized protein LOC127792953 isoform X2 [Diospyros lotus]|uniref:uncharacterized protein LOC127792953 isoform X2 n=1 Tax=Diospyros lotus TaxID=55363 RepID=UPI00225AAE27|nr:uncharacterized protein LOC127792953 isoform X2 [Diospyros lotus]